MHHSGQIGVSLCCIKAEEKGWLFRAQPFNDIGIDAHMEMTDDLSQSRQLLALQIKSGPSYFKEQKNNKVVFRDINERQYNYWTKNPLPCIIVLYNNETNTCVWEKLTKDTIVQTKKGYRIDVPLNQIFLDEKSNNDLLDYTNLPQHITNYNFLLSQRDYGYSTFMWKMLNNSIFEYLYLNTPYFHFCGNHRKLCFLRSRCPIL